MRIGIFGGSFSPVHYGHLLLAENCRDQAKLDQVWFIPTKISPLKQGLRPISDDHRLAMLELAITGNPAFQVSTMELDRGGVSYTVETLREIRERHPADDLFLLIGGDSLTDFLAWKSPAEICELATPLVVTRPGSPACDWSSLAGVIDPARIDAMQRGLISMPLVAFSSTEIRRRLAQGQTIRYQVPRSVEKYLQTHLSGEAMGST